MRTGVHGKQKEGNARKLEEDFSSNTNLGWISEEEPPDILKCQGKKNHDVAAEYLTFALCYLEANLHKETCGNTENIKESTENQACEKKASSSCVKDSGSAQDVIGVVKQRTLEDKFGNSNTRTGQLSEVHNTPLSKQRRMVDKEMLQSIEDLPQQSVCFISNSNQSFPSSSCSNFKQQLSSFSINESKDDIYKGLLGKIHNIVPKSYSLQGKGAFYTFSGVSNSDLILHLPKELTLHGYGDIFSKKFSQKNQCDVQMERKKDADSQKDSVSDFSDSETGNMSEQELFNSEADEHYHNAGLQNIRSDPETKIIQTRSGRKTRFTFFSKTLNDDSEDEMTEEEKNSFNHQKLSTPQKRLKLEPEPSVELMAPKRKRGRPRKNKEPDTVLNYKILGDGSAIIQRDSAENMTFSTGQLGSKISTVEKNLACTVNARDYVLSYLEEHQTERVKKEEELMNILKEQQAEQAGVLTKLLDIFQDLQSKLKVRK